MMMSRPEGALVMVVDVQERLLPSMGEAEALVGACARLVAAARLFEVPVIACEQYPQGLGPTTAALRQALQPSEVLPKISFSALADPAIEARVATLAPRQAVLCGLEAHVCVLQTALDLKARGLEVFVVADAIASRRPEHKALALDRLRAHGVECVCLEMVLFEWTGQAGGDRFRAVQAMIR